MTNLKTALLAAAALALAGTAAFAAGSDVHTMKVALADGSVATVQYTGDVAPKVSLAAPGPFAGFAPQFGFAPGFAQIDAMMNAQMRAMQQQIDAMMAMPMNGNAPIETAFGKMPAGANFCAQSVRITTDANGKQNIERHQSGNCGGSATSAPAEHVPAKHDDTI